MEPLPADDWAASMVEKKVVVMADLMADLTEAWLAGSTAAAMEPSRVEWTASEMAGDSVDS